MSMESRTLQVVPWRHRSVGAGAAFAETPRLLGAEVTAADDDRELDDGVGDDELPRLCLDQYESIWDAMLARL
jgi:hypothetical protein